MRRNITKLLKNKNIIILLLIFYFIYLGVLFILAIPYIPEMLITNPSYQEVYINPIIYFGAAAVIPVIIGFIILNFGTIIDHFEEIVVISLKELNYKVLGYITAFLLLQIGLNGIMVFFLVLIDPKLLNLLDFPKKSLSLVWMISCSFSLGNTLINIIIGWYWVKVDFELPNIVHWVFSYVIFFVVIGLGVIIIQIVNPTVKQLLLWPISGGVLIGAYNYFIMFFGLLIAGLEAILSPMTTGEGDAYVGFVFMVGTLFMIASSFFLFIHMISFYMGVILANINAKKTPTLK